VRLQLDRIPRAERHEGQPSFEFATFFVQRPLGHWVVDRRTTRAVGIPVTLCEFASLLR
jgi:hypothetical protein